MISIFIDWKDSFDANFKKTFTFFREFKNPCKVYVLLTLHVTWTGLLFFPVLITKVVLLYWTSVSF
jgi:hypothetical protein